MGKDLLYRLGGAALVAIGAGMGWIGILRPLRDAQAHAPMVSYDTKIFAAVPLCFVFGLFFLISGARWPYRDAKRQTLTPAGWGLMAAVALGAAASYFWFSHQFDALGYRAG